MSNFYLFILFSYLTGVQNEKMVSNFSPHFHSSNMTFCPEQELPCRFDSHTWKSFRGCIGKRYGHHCCPLGWDYNNNTADITCIAVGETVSGPGSRNQEGNRGCSEPEYPSCRHCTSRLVHNEPVYHHICQHKSQPCQGRCSPGLTLCPVSYTCVNASSWSHHCGGDVDKESDVSLNPGNCAFGWMEPFLPKSFSACDTMDGKCICGAGYQPCRFDGWNQKDSFDSYRGCIRDGSEAHCCQNGWIYNNNTFDVTCIGMKENLLEDGVVVGQGGLRGWCEDALHRSCRSSYPGEKRGGRPSYSHHYLPRVEPCYGRCQSGWTLCQTTNKCVEIRTWEVNCRGYGQSTADGIHAQTSTDGIHGQSTADGIHGQSTTDGIYGQSTTDDIYILNKNSTTKDVNGQLNGTNEDPDNITSSYGNIDRTQIIGYLQVALLFLSLWLEPFGF